VFQEREVWWCNIGVNIGDEEDGKSEFFSRPVLIIHKFNKKVFWGIPLTAQVKDNPNYHKIKFRDRVQ
jgi:mRNA interferase MazF